MDSKMPGKMFTNFVLFHLYLCSDVWWFGMALKATSTALKNYEGHINSLEYQQRSRSPEKSHETLTVLRGACIREQSNQL